MDRKRSLIIQGPLASVTITLATEDWGEASPEDVTKVLYSAANQILKYTLIEKNITIRVRRNPHPNSVPVTLMEPSANANGEYTVLLSCKDRLWSKYTYQFAHELVHVLMTSRSKTRQKMSNNNWLEEALGEAAAIFALRQMSKEWAVNPPYSNWAAYAIEHKAYADDAYRRDFPPDINAKSLTLGAWIWNKIGTLETERILTPNSKYVSANLLPLLEKRPKGWDAIRYLYLDDADASAELSQYLKNWVNRCPDRLKLFAREASLLLGVDVG